MHPSRERIDIGGGGAVFLRRALPAQVMRQAAGANDQNPQGPQRRQRPAQQQMVFGTQIRLQRKLHHGNVVFGIHQNQGHPGAVIQSAGDIAGGRQALGGQNRRDLPRQFRIPGRGVNQFVQRRREAEEIVDGGVNRNSGDLRPFGVPMRRSHQNRLWPFQQPPKTTEEIARRLVPQRHHGGAVADEQSGQHEQTPAVTSHIRPWHCRNRAQADACRSRGRAGAIGVVEIPMWVVRGEQQPVPSNPLDRIRVRPVRWLLSVASRNSIIIGRARHPPSASR